MRYFIGIYEVAGYFSGLAQGLRANGIAADCYLDTPTEFGYKYDDNWFNNAFSALRGDSGVPGNRTVVFFTRLLLRICLFVYCIFKYDVFVFSGFGSFFNFVELPVLRFFGKKVVVFYLGSDSRPAMFSGGFVDLPHLNNNPIENIQRTKKQIKLIRRVERSGCIVVNHTASAALFSKKFVPLLYIGIPMDLTSRVSFLQKVANSSGNEKTGKNTVRVVHAPSRPLAKGSPTLISELQKIQGEAKQKGIEIEIVSLNGVSNDVVLNEIQNADFVLNELYSDTYMSVLDAEAALYGKPSLKFGYYASKIISDNTSAQHPVSVLFWSPDKLSEILRQYIYDANLRAQQGRTQAEFLENCWNEKDVAARLNQLIVEPLLLKRIEVDPNAFSYHLGWGLTKRTWLDQVEPCLKLKEFKKILSPKHFKQVVDECEIIRDGVA